MSEVDILIDKLYLARLKQNKTRLQVANAMGLKRDTPIINWENGERAPNLTNLIKWCNALDLKICLANT